MLSVGSKLEVFNVQRQAQENGWWQIDMTLEVLPQPLLGARFMLGQYEMAVWRVKDHHVSCLMMPTESLPDVTLPVVLTHLADDLPEHLDSVRQLLVVGKDLGIVDVLLWSQQQSEEIAYKSLVLLSAESFPWKIKPARYMVSLLPEAIGACELLEDRGFANRLFCTQGWEGCHSEPIDDWLDNLLGEFREKAHHRFDKIVRF
jgi:hypothetical protein